MTYKIYITAAAERDILRDSDYIKFVLKNPKAADDLLDEAEALINSLAEFTNKLKLADEPVLASWGIHFDLVNGYLAFCVISEETHRITVVRFLFQKSNWPAILGHGFSLI